MESSNSSNAVGVVNTRVHKQIKVHSTPAFFSNNITAGDLASRRLKDPTVPAMNQYLSGYLKSTETTQKWIDQRRREWAENPRDVDVNRWSAFVAYEMMIERMKNKKSLVDILSTADGVWKKVPCRCHHGPRNCDACKSASVLHRHLVSTAIRDRIRPDPSHSEHLDNAWTQFQNMMKNLEDRPLCDDHAAMETAESLASMRDSVGFDPRQSDFDELELTKIDEDITKTQPPTADDDIEPHADEDFEMESVDDDSEASGFCSPESSAALSPPQFVPMRRPDEEMSEISWPESEHANKFLELMSQMTKTFQEFMGDAMDGNAIKLLDKIKSIMWFALFDWPKAQGYEKTLVVLRLLNELVGTEQIAKWAQWVLDMFKRDVEPQAEMEVDWSKDFSLLTSGAAYVKARKFGYALVTLAFAGAFGKQMSDGLFGKIWTVAQTMWKETSIIGSMFEFIIWFAKSMKAWLFGEKTIHQIMTDADGAADFDTRVARLNLMKKHVCDNSGKVSLTGYAMELNKLRRQAEVYLRVVPRAQRHVVSRQLSHILEHEAFLSNYYHAESVRPAPVSYLINGPTSVGKTVLCSYIVDVVQVRLGIDRGPQYVYHLDGDDKYMSNYGPGFNTIQEDDIANTLPEYLDKSPTASVINIVNNEPRKAVMADISEKGLYAINPSLYLATTNIEDLSAIRTSVEPLSILRRFDWHFNVSLKEGPWNTNGMLTPGTDPMQYGMDIWHIVAYRWKREANKLRKCDEREMNFTGMLKFVAEHCVQKAETQKRVVARNQQLSTVPMCEHHIHSDICPDCRINGVEQQSLQEYAFSCAKHLGRYMAPGNIKTASDRVDYTQMQQHVNGIFYRKMCGRWLQILAFLGDVRARPMTFEVALVLVGFNTLYFGLLMAFIKTLFLPHMMCTTFVAAYASTMFCRLVPYIYLTPSQTMLEVVQQQVRLPHRRKQLKVTAGIVCAVSAAYMAYKMWKINKMKPQGSAESRPVPAGVSNVRNVYVDQYIRPIEPNMNVRTMSAEQVEESFKKHVMFGRLTVEISDVCGVTCNVFPMESEHVILPYHVMQGGYKWLRLFFGDTSLQSNASRLISLDGNWVRIGTTDLVLVYSPIIADRKNFTPLLADSVSLKDNAVRTVMVKSEPLDDSDRNKRTFDVICGRANASTCVVDVKRLNYIYDGGVYNSPIPTYKGQCCAPIFTDRSSGPTLVGFHSAGDTGKTAARFCVLTASAYAAAKSALHKDDIVPQSQMHEMCDYSDRLDFCGTQWRWTNKPRDQMTSLWVAGEYSQLGYSTMPGRKLRSNIQITEWSDVLSVEYGLPRMHEAPRNIGSYVPWNMWLTSCADPSHVPPRHIKMAQADFVADLEKKFSKEMLHDAISPLDHLSTVNGVNGVPGCEPMKKNTSAGIPWCKPKREYMVQVEEPVENIADPWDFTPDIKVKIDELRQQLKTGCRAYVPHRCNLKDEAVKIGKEKVRVFLGSSLPYLYLMRQYFLPVSIFMQKHPLAFETGVGVNCYGKQWTRIVEYLTRFGESRIIAGDYAKYDQKMEIALTKAAFEILLWLCRRAGYDDEAMMICRGLMTETIAGCYDLRGEWIGLTSSNPSGHALTVIINSIVNSLYMRCAFYELRPEGDGRKFAECVALLTYGDDNIAGVAENAPWFNHTAISNVLRSWNIEYTMADKEAESVDYITIHEATFLKRSFVKRDGMWLAPLDESSIMKTLHTYLKSSAIDVKEQHAQLLLAANREYFLYGREVFEQRRAMLMRLAQQFKVDHFFKNCQLDDWDAACVWFAEQ